ncbi:MAG: FAD-dependent oxidoreductase [Acidobacteria bacterium]|nr:FAD-dependent oxidoreductase [Acidobacteriota bacterium]
MKKIALIGAGISGLAAAYYLSRRYEVSLFEKDQRLGGHTHTVEVDSSRGKLAVDTGFIVHNTRTYPNLIRLLNELNVETQPSDMSFSVSHQATGFEYSSRGSKGFFAQRRNFLSLQHYALFTEILRFNRQSRRLLDTPQSESITLGEYMEAQRFGKRFREMYLYPMASAVWSTSLVKVLDFPAATLIRFFDNHGMLGVNTNPQWRVIKGGSSRYIKPLIAPFQERVFTGQNLLAVERADAGVKLRFADKELWFDEVVFACHGNQILPLLATPTEAEVAILKHFHTSRNETVLHTDSRLLPRRPNARASWNYHVNDASLSGTTLTYHMNRLQTLDTNEDYCVSLNTNGAVDKSTVIRNLVYHHPLYTREAIAAQQRWAEISGKHHTHFCGAYWLYGFHEDGLNSALRVARALGVDC